MRAFKDKSEDYSDEEKRKVVLMTLILLAYVRKVYQGVYRILP
jgi:succinate dehydrogenase hydrophobic anchor subunit